MIEYCLFIEISFMCQDLRLYFTRIEAEDHNKNEESTFRGSTFVIGVSQIALTAGGYQTQNTKHRIFDRFDFFTVLLKLTQGSFKGKGSGILDKHFFSVVEIAA